MILCWNAIHVVDKFVKYRPMNVTFNETGRNSSGHHTYVFHTGYLISILIFWVDYIIDKSDEIFS